jgi:hypothetical protein
MDVRVQSAAAPPTFEFESAPLKGELERLDRGVELGGDAERIEPEASERVVRFRLEHGVEVIDDFHPPRI